MSHMTAVRDLLISELHTECDDLRAENERLRAALKEALDGWTAGHEAIAELYNCGGDDDMKEHEKRIAELRKLAEGGGE
jgi:hypothetical protein